MKTSSKNLVFLIRYVVNYYNLWLFWTLWVQPEHLLVVPNTVRENFTLYKLSVSYIIIKGFIGSQNKLTLNGQIATWPNWFDSYRLLMTRTPLLLYLGYSNFEILKSSWYQSPLFEIIYITWFILLIFYDSWVLWRI